MANADTPRGLVPVNMLTSADFNAKVNAYYVPSTYATALFVGDAVVKTGTANTSAVSGVQNGLSKEFAAGTLPEVNLVAAGATNAITGVIVGFSPREDESITYNPASTERVVYVCDDPSVLYEIQADSGAEVAATDIGTNANLIYTHSGDTAYGISGAELDTSDMSADATYQLTIRRLVNAPDNALGTNAKLEVFINIPTERPGVAGI